MSVSARVVERLLEERPQSRDAVERIKLDVAPSCTTAGLPTHNVFLPQLDPGVAGQGRVALPIHLHDIKLVQAQPLGDEPVCKLFASLVRDQATAF